MIPVYDAIGGGPALQALVDGLYERLVTDPAVGHHFVPERLPTLKSAQVRWFTAVLQGELPPGDLAAIHAGLDISDAQVEAVIGHLDAVLGELGVDRTLQRAVISLVGRLWYARRF